MKTPIITNELKWAVTLSDRNQKLTEADNLVNTALDQGIDATPFRQYRQALRDIPQTFTNPDEVVWPQKPSLPASA